MRHIVDLLARRFVELRRVSRDLSITIGRPARKADIHRLKRTVPALPPELEAFFLEASENVQLDWTAGDEVLTALPRNLRGVTGSFFEISLKETERLAAHWPPSGSRFGAKQLFPLIEMMTGDVIVCVNDPALPATVTFVDHETGEVLQLSDSIKSFLEPWVALGCPGPERDAIEPFINPAARGLDLTLPAARQWTAALGFLRRDGS